MAEEDVGKFSVIKSNFRIFEEDGIEHILKEINLNSLPADTCESVRDYILQYVSKMREAGIPMPEVKRHYTEDGKMFFVCKYEGRNILQTLTPEELSRLLHDEGLVSQVFGVIQKAQKANLSLDPHIKNFVLNNGEAHYVDFTPPYLPEYNQMVIDNTPEEHKELVTRNLDAFLPGSLGYHFAGDLLKEDVGLEEIMGDLYTVLRNRSIVDGSYDSFLERATEIKEIELERLRRNVFLI